MTDDGRRRRQVSWACSLGAGSGLTVVTGPGAKPRTNSAQFPNSVDLCGAAAREGAPASLSLHQRSKGPHERRKPCTNCVNVTDAFSRKVPTYCAATPLRRCAKSALAPVKGATRDFSEASRLRLTGTK